MLISINIYKKNIKEYIELWIHEIKTPIAAGGLIVQNNKNEVTKSIDEELDKIEYYVEQAFILCKKQYCRKKITVLQSVTYKIL